jgi:chromosome segregation ATPase
MTTHDLDTLRALHEQAVAECQRLSAEVARLREERDEARAEVNRALAEMGQAVVEADAARAALYDLAAAVRSFEADGGALPVRVKIRRINAEDLLDEKATDLTARYDFRARAALASLGSPQGSPQDERNTKKEDA